MNRSEKARFIGLAIANFIGFTGIDWYENGLSHATESDVLGRHIMFSLIVPSVYHSILGLIRPSKD